MMIDKEILRKNRVTHVQQENIYDFENLTEMFSWKNIAAIMEVQINSDDPSSVNIKYDLNHPSRTLNIIKKGYSIQDVLDYLPYQLYTAPLKIEEEKLNNLRDILNRFVPPNSKSFLEKLIENQESNDNI